MVDPADNFSLVSVYEWPDVAPKVLYQLLAERDATVNISHRQMPSWEQHLAFIARRPYDAWYIVRYNGGPIGGIYLTALSEIGIGILAEFRNQGFAPRAIHQLMALHPRDRYLANINPANAGSIRMFAGMGFQLIQHTYELRPDDHTGR